MEGGILATSHVKERFFEIDVLRGVAVIMMVIFHASFDLAYFGIWHENMSTGPWRLLALLTASLFLFLVGVSLSISGATARAALTPGAFYAKYLSRGMFIFLLSLGITTVTFFLVPGETIVFGILHLIGVSVMLAPVFLRFHWGNLAAGILCLVTGTRFALPSPSFPLQAAFLFLGRHSLAIYLLHQPVILVAIGLIWHPAGLGFG